MKVVLFCGGLGTTAEGVLGERSEAAGRRSATGPMLWHVMKYYAHFGHKDFILCLGYAADLIKEYFLNYDECYLERLRQLATTAARRSSSSTATSTTGASPSSTRA